MKKQFQALGHDVNIRPSTGLQIDPTLIAGAASGSMQDAAAMNMAPMQGPVDGTRVKEWLTNLQDYKKGKANLEARIIENNEWWKRRHWEFLRKGQKQQEIEPTSAWMFSTVANKHADITDNFPEPNILPREADDDQDAKILSSIVPVILERNEFEETYSDAAWYLLKNGTVPYGVFWDKEKENGLGDISVVKLDLLNLFWEPGIRKIQKSRYLFIISLTDTDQLKEAFPWVNKNATTTLTVADYAHDESIDNSKKSVVVDVYYKVKQPTGKTILHYGKFVGETLLYSSENDPMYAQRGWYDHGQYPVVFDVLYPEEDSPVGFGYIDICKEPQLYIDKLDQIIMKNAVMSGTKRWFVPDNGGMNEQDYADWSKAFVKVTGSLDDRNIKEIDIKPLDPFIIQHKQMKIDENKETAGDRDFSQGGTTGGVTAASAIAALQEAGNKRSRDTNKGSYRAYTKINYLVIENIRQFYTEARNFRIVGEQSAAEYIAYSNQKLVAQQIPPAYPGGEPTYRLPIFDIKVRPQRSNPFNRYAQNELALQLYGAGFFNPANADASLMALEMMDIEGKQKLMQQISKNGGLFQQVQQLVMLIDKLTGGGTGAEPAGGSSEPPAKGTAGQANARAASNANVPFGMKGMGA